MTPTDDVSANVWPSLPTAAWAETRDTLILWTQVIGKVRLARTPLVNHWWNTPLYVDVDGLTTSLIPDRPGRSFQIDFDLVRHQLEIVTTDGGHATVALAPKSVRAFYAEVMAALDDLDLHTDIWTMPVEIPDAVAFDLDDEHASYEPDHVQRFWQVLVQFDRVFHEFRSRFLGKASPVHVFWGALDLAVTRFSGRPAPLHPGGAPNCGPHVMEEAYSHEVSSAGYWPGGDGEGLVYSYAYPEPAGFRDAPIGPAGAFYDDQLGEFVLPYELMRSSADPDAMLLDFLQSTYEAAADGADWDRAALERHG